MTHVAVVVNPERTALSQDFLDALRATEVEVEVIEAEAADGLEDAVRRGVDGGAAVVAAIGGDGTQRAAACALRGTDVALAVVPGGTVNLLGQVLGITSVEDAVAAIAGGRTRAIDLGLRDGEPFVLNASTGFDATTMHDVDDEAKQLGRLGYFLTGWRALQQERPRPVVVEVDGRVAYDGRAMTVLVANFGQRASASFTLVPGAEPDDGVLDVLVHRRAGPVSLARAVVALTRGQRPSEEDVLTARGQEVEVRWSRPVWSQRDGDALQEPVRQVTYRVDAGAVRVCVPPEVT